MKIEIDQSKCEGHARCAAAAADLFPLDDDGYIDTTGFTVPEGREDDVRIAVAACPERVISLVS
ncbi:MAG: ferredoxin [Leifsonia flava]